jgi:aldose 1-epimerase
VNADSYVETDDKYIPTGNIVPVTDSVYDFRERRKIDKFFAEMKTGYNECLVLNKNQQADAILFEPASGIRMTVTTSAPGILLYTGDFLHTHFIKNQGICLETQFFPDSPNQEQFPSTLLGPGEEYLHHTVFAFDHG